MLELCIDTLDDRPRTLGVAAAVEGTLCSFAMGHQFAGQKVTHSPTLSAEQQMSEERSRHHWHDNRCRHGQGHPGPPFSTLFRF
ncbi:MAG: hypothetical protein AAF416_19065 [Pseudomonadota bacterium]